MIFERKKITQEELNEILKNHKLWLNSNGKEGERADLSYTDLSYTDLSYTDLSYTDLSYTDLRYANLEGAYLYKADLYKADLYKADLYKANLYKADLRGANLYKADLRGANLYSADLYRTSLNGANLEGADLYKANLRKANLYNANLTNANITGANLYNADLEGANLTNVKYDSSTKYFSLACPEQGEFIGYKKAWGRTPDGYHTEVIVELLILSDAKRSSATTSKCRCNKAKVLSITDLDGKDIGIIKTFSDYDNSFIYKVGETVEVGNFNENRWEECAPGIHFFMDREMSVVYRF